jgi:predicted membrane protein
MIVLGIILCVIGWATGLSILYTIGSILLAIGLIFLVLGLIGRPVAGRTWY